MADAELNPGLVEFRLDRVERAIESISSAFGRLVSIEERHVETRQALERAFVAIKEVGARVGEVEKEMPTLQLARKWVIGGVMTGIGLIGSGVVAWVVKLSHP
jgi:hypothetical protein